MMGIFFIMKKLNYQDQFKDPRWQKKRLVILNRDDFTCQHCGDNRSELHVHHRHYDKACKAWEYEDDVFVTLCARCHLIEHDGILYAKEMAEWLIDYLIMRGTPSNAVAYFLNGIGEIFNNIPYATEEEKRVLNGILANSISLQSSFIHDENYKDSNDLRL